MAFTLTCSGPITIDASYRPVCVDGWVIEELQSIYMDNTEFLDLWSIIIPLFVAAVGVRYVISVFKTDPGRHG